MCYIMKFENKASLREFGHMKKLNRQEILHYIKNKGFTPLDSAYALVKVNKDEKKFIDDSQPQWKNILMRTKKTIKEFLKCRKKIVDIEIALNDLVMRIYKFVSLQTSSAFFKNFYRELAIENIDVFEMYEIKK